MVQASAGCQWWGISLWRWCRFGAWRMCTLFCFHKTFLAKWPILYYTIHCMLRQVLARPTMCEENECYCWRSGSSDGSGAPILITCLELQFKAGHNQWVKKIGDVREPIEEQGALMSEEPPTGKETTFIGELKAFYYLKDTGTYHSKVRGKYEQHMIIFNYANPFSEKRQLGSEMFQIVDSQCMTGVMRGCPGFTDAVRILLHL